MSHQSASSPWYGSKALTWLGHFRGGGLGNTPNFERVSLWCCGLVAGGCLLLHRIFTPPRAIRHLPYVPILPLLRSYFLCEPDDVRFQRLVVPFANEKGEGVVVVWALGQWMIHIIDHKLFAEVTTALHVFPKTHLSAETMLQRYLGTSSVTQANGDEWKKLSSHLQKAFAQPLPIGPFVSLARIVFEVIESTASSKSAPGFTVRWSDITQNFTLDAVGTSIIGHHFDALRARSPFVVAYNQMMHDIAQPVYLIFPLLERLCPRRKVVEGVDSLRRDFQQLIDAKRSDPGDDIMTYLLKDPEMSPDQLLDNMAVLFLAGHDTTASAMSSLVYYLAVDARIQTKAREEVLRVLGPTGDPSVALVNAQSMPYLSACIRETLRINPSASILNPRLSLVDHSLGRYHIPAGSQIVCNVYAVHHAKSIWTDPEAFRPERFMQESGERHQSLSFSVGPRQCPAQNFAQYELRTLVSMLLRRYEWSLPEGSIHADGVKNSFSTFSLMSPRDLDITFELRNGQPVL